MALNKYRPHVIVVPEDDATRQIAIAFMDEITGNTRDVQVEAVARGWPGVINCFKADHVRDMQKFRQRFMILLIGFDNHDDRLERMKQGIPEDLVSRVLVIGVLTNPEKLRRATSCNLADLGRELAADCRDNTTKLWNHELLRHNLPELDRMKVTLRPILFPND